MTPFNRIPIPCAVVTQNAPRVYVTVRWDTSTPSGEARLYVKRYGETENFAYYPALEVAGGVITFQVDDLLFEKGTGRYEASLQINEVEYTKFQIDYRSNFKLLGVEKASV